ncbi:MAG: hypothetical protein NDJ90_03265 [Oligoflexia bacterium]|nr:hypothetical protein [Oligoflexia bacterium]
MTKTRWVLAAGLALSVAAFGCVTVRIQDQRGEQAKALRRTLASESVDPDRAKMSQEIARLQELVEQALVWREISTEGAKLLKDKLEQGKLSHEDIETLHKKAREYWAHREELLSIVSSYMWTAHSTTRFRFRPGEGTTINLKERSADDPTPAGAMPGIYDVVVDPSDAEGRRTLMGMKMSLGAALVLYDNYVLGIYPFQKSKELRYLINKDDPEGGRLLGRITESFLNIANRQMISVAISRTNEDLKWKTSSKVASEPEDAYLDALVMQSPAYNYLMSGKAIADMSGLSEAAIFKLADELSYVQRVLTFATSFFFGNTMGLVQFRKGYLTKLPKHEVREIDRTMRPLDILLEKTPFRLTDRFIPGHYGHVAIWVGDEAQLKELGVWDDPKVVPYQAQIREGRRIVEALRPGVQINTLEHFLNIDDLLVLRHPALTLEEKREYVVRAFEQVGKEYDFNFDVDSEKRIVCSELAYVVYHNIQWPKDKQLGRYTISPDQVAIKGLPGGPLEPVLIYHDGKKVPDRLPEVLGLLLEERYDIASQVIGESREKAGLK